MAQGLVTLSFQSLSRHRHRFGTSNHKVCRKRLNSNKGTKTLTGFFATFYARRTFGILRFPKLAHVFSANFGGLIPSVSCKRSCEKSYSPKRLTCCHDSAEPWVNAFRIASRRAGSSISARDGVCCFRPVAGGPRAGTNRRR